MNKLKWNLNTNSRIFIKENAFENVICQMDSMSSRPQGVHHFYLTIRGRLNKKDGLSGYGDSHVKDKTS